MFLGLGKIEDLDRYKAETRPRGSNASWQMAQMVTVWYLVMLCLSPDWVEALRDTGSQFLLIQAAVIGPWAGYGVSRHINKHRTNVLNAEKGVEVGD